MRTNWIIQSSKINEHLLCDGDIVVYNHGLKGFAFQWVIVNKPNKLFSMLENAMEKNKTGYGMCYGWDFR